MNVLVVEANPFIRDMAVTELEEAGHKVMDAASGGQAIRLLQTGIAVDVLLTDIRMPEANGWEVAGAYRQRFPDLPVVYVTGHAEQMQPVTGGMILYKPYKTSQVVDLLNALLVQGAPPPSIGPRWGHAAPLPYVGHRLPPIVFDEDGLPYQDIR